MNRTTPIAWLVAAALGCGGAWAQVEIDKRRPAAPEGEVYIENAFGSITVIGWDQAQVAVSGRLAAGAEGLDLWGEKQEVGIDVEIPEAWLYDADAEDDSEYRSMLEVRVPAGSSVHVETLNAPVDVRGVRGRVEVDTVNGTIRIEGNPSAVDVDGMTGAVSVSAVKAPMEVETISGAVTLGGASGEVRVDTVSGDVRLDGSALKEVRVESTTGNVEIAGDLTAEGEIDVETFSGSVDLLLPRSVQARFECVTFSGQIENEIGPKPRRDPREPHLKLRFSTGLNEYEISVETFKGDIRLRVGDEPTAR